MLLRLQTFAQISGLVTVGVALVVLASWPLEILALRGLLVDGATMKPITALLFGLAGLSLWLQCNPRPQLGASMGPRLWIAQACAALVIVAGAVLLAESALGLTGSIGDLLFPSALAATGIPNPGRASMATAFCFVLLGLALLLLNLGSRPGVRTAQTLSFAVLLVGLIGFEGYIFGMDALRDFAPFASVAVHTAVLFMVLGVAVPCARPDQGLMAVITSQYGGGQIARRLLPVAVVLPIVIAVPRLVGERLDLYEAEVGVAIVSTSIIVIFTIVIWFAARDLNRIDDERHQAASATDAALAELELSHQQVQQEVEERRRAEAAARASEARFTAAFQASPAGMTLSRLPRREFAAVNASLLAMTGLTERDLQTTTVDELGVIDPEDLVSLRNQLRQSGGVRDMDIRFRTTTGDARHGLISVQPVDIDSQPFLLTTLVDITLRVQAESELRESNHQLETALVELRSAQRQIIEQERITALGQLAGGIAHDFNNALGPILGYSDMMLENPELLHTPEESVEYLRAINVAAQGAAAVVSRLRDFYRRRQNGDAQGPAHLPDLIAQAISLTRPRWKDQAQASGAMIEVVAEVHDVPALAGNPSELRDALVNLILNAVDAMPAGGTITIRTYQAGEHVVLEVADTGAGMTEDVRRRCLEPFFTTKGDRGTGLGLGIVHGIVQRHGGAVEVESEVGVGTTMRLRLSARLHQEGAAAGPQQSQEVRHSLRVLVVDDEPMMRQVVARFLAIDEHVVETASNGREALSFLQATTFDLVITDRAMPEMGGDELASMVKVLAPATPVLMLTGFGDLMDAADQQPEGVDLVIPKPTTLARLRLAVATLVSDPSPAVCHTTEP